MYDASIDADSGGVGGVGGGDGDTASGEKRDEADQVEGERLLSGRGEWKPLMRPCVIRELSRPNEALTYLSY